MPVAPAENSTATKAERLQRRALVVAVLILAPGCFVQAWILANLPGTATHEPWTFSAVGTVALLITAVSVVSRPPI